MGLKVGKVIKKVFRATTAVATGGLSETKMGKNIVAGIMANPLQAAAITAGAVATGGLAGAGLLAAGALTTGKQYASKVKAEKMAQDAQDAYDRAVAEENARAATAKRASLLSLRRQYTKKVGTSGVGGGGSEDETDTLLG